MHTKSRQSKKYIQLKIESENEREERAELGRRARSIWVLKTQEVSLLSSKLSNLLKMISQVTLSSQFEKIWASSQNEFYLELKLPSPAWDSIMEAEQEYGS